MGTLLVQCSLCPGYYEATEQPAASGIEVEARDRIAVSDRRHRRRHLKKSLSVIQHRSHSLAKVGAGNRLMKNYQHTVPKERQDQTC